MAQRDLAHENLNLAVHEDQENGFAIFGAVVADAFIPIARVNLAEYNDAIGEAAEEALAAQQAEQQRAAQQPQQPAPQGGQQPAPPQPEG